MTSNHERLLGLAPVFRRATWRRLWLGLSIATISILYATALYFTPIEAPHWPITEQLKPSVQSLSATRTVMFAEGLS
jgi:hypothetical protein